MTFELKLKVEWLSERIVHSLVTIWDINSNGLYLINMILKYAKAWPLCHMVWSLLKNEIKLLSDEIHLAMNKLFRDKLFV